MRSQSFPGIPVRFICINRPAIKDMDEIRSLSVSERLPVFIMDRFMLPPWGERGMKEVVRPES